MPEPIELIINVQEVLGRIEDIEAEIEVALYARTQRLTHMFAERVRQNLSGDVLQERSGKLLGTVMEVGPTATGSEIISSVQAGGDEAPYGIVHEKGGERWYMIYPVNGRALAFEINGKTVFAASVHHPPAERRPWFEPVVDEISALWGDELQAAIGEVFKR
jgi:hypothetical protein